MNNSLLKGFEILSLFTPHQREISAATVVEKLGMNTATAHRFLMTLEHAGAVRSTKRGYFALGSKIEELGWIAEESDSLPQVLQPVIDALSAELNESVMVCRLARHGPTCVAVANSSRAISVNISIGTMLPLHASAQGKLWLAELTLAERKAKLSTLPSPVSHVPLPDHAALDAAIEEVKAQGYALNLGENEPDIAAVSVPVKNGAGKTVLTLSVFGMLSRFDEAFQQRALVQLREAADQISQNL